MTDASMLERLASGHASGAAERTGLPSYCTAHPDVLLAILREYRDGDDSILIEATCNQVNQFGGYTGMKPVDFANFILDLAGRAGVDETRLILGGDHLGPNPWRGLSADQAMANAEKLVSDYVAAGFTKIHLDASMPCADDNILSDVEIASRAARLCLAAERAATTSKQYYIIGSEVPTPGGESSGSSDIKITDAASVHRTLDAHRAAFKAHDLGAALGRVVGLVTQPGVDFSNAHIRHFDPHEAVELFGALNTYGNIVYEAHSTDYQNLSALAALVSGRFAILKVGPELTHAYREAVQIMAELEETSGAVGRSEIMAALSDALDRNPDVWRPYISRDENPHVARLSGLSDRVRYVWPDQAVQHALGILRQNIGAIPSEAPWLPACVQDVRARFGEINLTLFDAIVQDKVGAVVRRYRAACGEISIEQDR